MALRDRIVAAIDRHAERSVGVGVYAPPRRSREWRLRVFWMPVLGVVAPVMLVVLIPILAFLAPEFADDRGGFTIFAFGGAIFAVQGLVHHHAFMAQRKRWDGIHERLRQDQLQVLSEIELEAEMARGERDIEGLSRGERPWLIPMSRGSTTRN